jgi:hypothetical protein
MDTIKNLNLYEEIPNLETVTSEHIEAISKTLEEKYSTFRKHKLENSSKLLFLSREYLPPFKTKPTIVILII